MIKKLSDNYLYKRYSEYDKKLFEFIMKAERIDTRSKEFADVAYNIRMRNNAGNALIKVMKSDNVIFGYLPGRSLPKALKVFVANDVKENRNKEVVFIDVTDCFVKKDGVYVCKNIEWVIAYLINAMTSFIYTKVPNKIVNNSSVIKDGCQAFVKCFSYIIDRIYKISTDQMLRKRVEYMAALYYQIHILCKDYEKSYDTIKATAMKIAGLMPKDTQYVDILIEDDCFDNIDKFIININRIFKLSQLTLDVVLDKWMQSFGPGTVFAIEYFPAFSMMLTNAYVGGYIDSQRTIENIAGQDMVKFVKTILQIGASVA